LSREAFVNASPLIILAGIGRIDLLKLAGEPVTIPGQVMTELAAKGPTDPVVIAMSQAPFLRAGAEAAIPDDLGMSKLGMGELSVLAMARRAGATAVLDDLQARQLAVRQGVPVVGTLGLISRAKAARLITMAGPLIDAAVRNGMFLSPAVRADLLHRLGE
jgi:predicted nucleic acid-binding protein